MKRISTCLICKPNVSVSMHTIKVSLTNRYVKYYDMYMQKRQQGQPNSLSPKKPC